MDLCVFHSVNSGLYLWDGMAGLLIDGIHGGPEYGLSPMPEFLVKQLAHHTGLFAHTDGVLFTHLHGDHFQHQGLLRLMNTPESPAVYGPGLSESQAMVRPIRAGMCRIQMAGAYILAKDTVHDGNQFRAVKHQSYFIKMGGETVFVAGDAMLTAKEATSFAGFYGGGVEAGFFNVYQLLSPRSQDFIRILNPKRIFLEHLPFLEDDKYHYWELARQINKHFPTDLPQPELLPHMSWLDGKAAQWEPREKGALANGISGVTQHGSLL